MKRDYHELFDEVHASPYLKQEVLNLKNLPQKESKRRLNVWPALIAAMMCLSLCIGAAAGVYYSLGTWILDNGVLYDELAMDQNKVEFIDHLSQPVNQSHTIDGVTVWIDSVTIGDDSVWVLINVSGLDFGDEEYYFESWVRDSISPLMQFPTFFWNDEEVRISDGSELQYKTENGIYSKLYRFGAHMPEGTSMSDGTFTLRWNITNICKRINGKLVPMKEGTWSFTIPLTGGQETKVRTIDRIETELPIYEPRNIHDELIVLEDIRISCTSIRFYTPGKSPHFNSKMFIVLNDGSEVSCSFMGVPTWPGDDPHNKNGYHQLRPEIPLNVDNIVALRFGDYVVPLTEPEQ